MKTALLVIDIQTALCRGKWAMHEVDRVIERINQVAAKARAAGAPVVLIQHESEGEPLRFGSAAWQLDARLEVDRADLRVRKTATDAFHKTELQALLQARGVDRLIVCGLQSEFCVDSSVRGALAHGYPVVLVSDGHSTRDNGVLSAAQITAHHNLTLANLDSYGPGVELIAAAQVRVTP